MAAPFRAVEFKGLWLLAKGLLFTKGGMIVIALLSVLAWRVYDLRHQRAIGEAVAFENSIREGLKNNAKNEPIRVRADRPGAASRVRYKFCRDC